MTAEPQSAEEWGAYINKNREQVVGGYGGEHQPSIIQRIQRQAYQSGFEAAREMAAEEIDCRWLKGNGKDFSKIIRNLQPPEQGI